MEKKFVAEMVSSKNIVAIWEWKKLFFQKTLSFIRPGLCESTERAK